MAETQRKILLVDDDADLLSSMRRQLRKRFEVRVATGGEEGLKLLKAEGPFVIVISDYRMPGMDGMQFFSRVKEESPETVRILLTGNADLNLAITAVNEGNVFRLLTKPCSMKDLAKAIIDALTAHRQATAEKEILRNTVAGAVKLVMDVLALIKPEIYGRFSRILPYVRAMSKSMKDPEPWNTETAAMLSMVGYLSLPEKLAKKVLEGRRLSKEDEARFAIHADAAAKLVASIPRLESVAGIIEFQEKHFDGSGAPEGEPGGENIPLGARILKVAADFDNLLHSNPSKAAAVKSMRQEIGVYDPAAIDALFGALGDEAKYYERQVYPLGLEAGMILAQDVWAELEGKKIKLLSRNQELSATTIEYIYKNAEHMLDITQPIKVREALDKSSRSS